MTLVILIITFTVYLHHNILNALIAFNELLLVLVTIIVYCVNILMLIYIK
jgi:hypothetical protein